MDILINKICSNLTNNSLKVFIGILSKYQKTAYRYTNSSGPPISTFCQSHVNFQITRRINSSDIGLDSGVAVISSLVSSLVLSRTGCSKASSSPSGRLESGWNSWTSLLLSSSCSMLMLLCWHVPFSFIVLGDCGDSLQSQNN